MPGTPELRDKDQQINDVEQPSRNMSGTDDKSTPTYISMQTIDKIGDSSFESRDYTTESKKQHLGQVQNLTYSSNKCDSL